MNIPTNLELWKELDENERNQACRDYLTSDKFEADGYELVYARFMRVRAVAWMRKPVDSRAQDLSRVLHNADFKPLVRKVLRAYLFHSKGKLLAAFLDALKIAHENGLISGEPDPPSDSDFRKAAESLTTTYSLREIWLYLGYLCCGSVDGLWKNLPAVYTDLNNRFKQAASVKENTGNEIDFREPEAPEVPDEFTTLDELVVKAVVSAANLTEGALDRVKLDDLVNELVALNADRKRSYFHRGFFHSLFDVSFEFSFMAENHERRCWYMTGVLMGLMRMGKVQPQAAASGRYIGEIIRSQKPIIVELAEDLRLGCGKLLVAGLYPHLIEAGEVDIAALLVENQVRRLPLSKKTNLLEQVLAHGSDYLRQGKLAEAHALLQIVPIGIADPSSEHSLDSPALKIQRQGFRKLGQCAQAMGKLAEAETYFNVLLTGPDDEERREALTDMGLLRAGLRSLRSVLPGKDPERWPLLISNLHAGKAYFEDAVTSSDRKEIRGVRNAHLVLGIMSTLHRPDASAAATHLERAYTGMLRKREAYAVGAVLDWTRFLLGLAHLESLDPAFSGKGRELIEESISAGNDFAIELWRRCLDAAALLDDLPLCRQVADYLFEQRPTEVLHAIKGSAALLRSNWLRRRYCELLAADTRMPLDERFREWLELLKICRKEGDPELMAEVLAQLEELSLRENHFCDQFVSLLETPEYYSPGWEAEDASLARARALESLGRLDEAKLIYERRFYSYTERGLDHCVAQAREFYEKASKLGIPDGIEEMKRRLLACESSLNENGTADEVISELKSGASVDLLYVGGNEIQEAFDDKIQQRLTSEFPGVRIEFYHPGWGSNWNRSIEDIRRLIPTVDLVILSPLVRTEFGRSLRKLCNDEHPWFASTAKGQSGIRESIKRFAILAYKRKRSLG